MYYTDDSLLPENMPPLMITGAPYGPVWMPEDCTPENKLPVTWEEQTQAAVDCFNAGATILHIHVRDPKTGHISKNFKEYGDKEYGEQFARLRKAVPKMILQVGGSISFAPEPGEKAEFGSYDARHKLCEIEPKPDQITVSCGSTLYDHTAINRLDDAWAGTRYTNPEMAAAMSNLVADATPEFYLENIKRCVQHGIQPCFALAHVHALELVERLIRRGYYKGPVNGFFSMGVGGACGVNPFDMMELVRRTPQGSTFAYQSTFRHTYAVSMMMVALGQHTRAGIEDNLWGPKRGERFSTLQMIEKQVKMAELIGRPIATAEQTRAMLKIGVSYETTEETLAALGLPPNRVGSNAGFHVHVTDGKLHKAQVAGSDGHMIAAE